MAVTGGAKQITSAVEIAGGGLAVLLSNSGVLQIPGNVSDDNGAESLTLAGDGSGQLVLSGTNTYGGGTVVESGTLVVAGATLSSTGRA